jgi:alanyl-tRNA synthetase
LNETDQKILIKNLNNQLETLSIKLILNDKTKNIIKDEVVKSIKVRFQNVKGLPSKELRKLVDDGKKELGAGIVVVFANKDDKVGVAVGVTSELTKKFDAVKLVKLSSEIIGGQGGGGRKDFAQAGGQDSTKIDQAFKEIVKSI